MRILFITSTRIGDAVLSSGLITHLLDRYPGARLTIACGPLAADLFRDVPRLDRLITVRKRKGDLHWVILWAACVQQRWDVIVDLRSSAIAWLLRAGQRYVQVKSAEHRVAAAARLLGLSVPQAPRIYAGPQAKEKAEAIIGAGPVLAVGPTANWLGKQWPVERFEELVGRLTSGGGIFEGAKILLLGAPHERETARPLIEAIPGDRLIDQFGKIDLLTAYACLERSDFYIGNDSGLMHLAAAAGAPTLGLFGPTNEALYGPWGPLTESIRGDTDFEKLTAGHFDFSAPVCHMLGLSVERVEGAVKSLWNKAQTAKAGGPEAK